MSHGVSKSPIALAVAAALGTTAVVAVTSSARADTTGGTYVTGDFHNHTTCSDGSISMQKLVKKSTDKTDTPWGLDWFVQAGHGGSGNRNCTLAEDASLATPAYPLVYASDGTTLQGPQTTWQNTNPAQQPKGAAQGSSPTASMWRWQTIQEYQYPILEYLSALNNKPLFLGLESVVAGHEHSSMSVVTGQMPASIFTQTLPTTPGYSPIGNANAFAQWAYCFDRGVSDTSRGNTTTTSGIGNNFDCTNPASSASTSTVLGWNEAAKKLIPAGGTGGGTRGHQKTVEALKWMAEFHPNTSYYVPAHLERAGPFNPNGNNGYNVEHLRNFNNAAPNIAFGMETQPGHGASDTRGEYTLRRNGISGINVDSVGGTTYGGTGVYGAQIGGVWDALLGEGRNFWFFASSDWHGRGFTSDDRRTVGDFYPGEYQRDYVMVKNTDTDALSDRDDRLTPQEIVDGLRSGNSFAATGQVIDRLVFVACASLPGNGRSAEAIAGAAVLLAGTQNTDVELENCATMGQKLVVQPGSEITIAIAARDPIGTNYSPYSFPNPSLQQIGINQPMNKPELDHIDVIRGMVTGYKDPTKPAEYAGAWPSNWLDENNPTVLPSLATVPDAAKNTSAQVIRVFNSQTWKAYPGLSPITSGFKVMTFRLSGIQQSQYVRLRGTNLPPSTPWETDANGNPLTDLFTNSGSINRSNETTNNDSFPENFFLKIPCTTAGTNVPAVGEVYTGNSIDGCPSHLPTVEGQKMVATDVAAWADLWFYSNPIFVEVEGSTEVKGVQ